MGERDIDMTKSTKPKPSGKMKSLSPTSTRSIKGESKTKTGIRGIEELSLEKIRENENIRLEDLVNELTSDLGYSKDRVLRRLMELQTEGKILVQEKPPFKSLLDYARSPISLWFWGATVATLLSLGLIGVSSGIALYLRYIFGGLLILFLPGYTLIELLYAKRKELDDLTRIALSIGLSLAIVPLVGLVLNYSPFGIRLIPVAVSLTVVTMILLILALQRKHTYYKISKDVM